MNLNITPLPDFSILSQEEIVQEYENLFKRYEQIKKSQDEDKQKIYELKRNLDTANANEAYLNAELELISSNQAACVEEIKQKHNHEIETLKKNYSELLSDFNLLEKKSEDLQKTNDKLVKDVANMENNCQSSKNSSNNLNENLEIELYKIEKKNIELLGEIDDYHDKIKQMTIELLQHEKNVEVLEEKTQFLEENLEYYKNQLEEKTNLLEKAQEKIIELKIEINTKKTTGPENDNKKGNSLFAEVDDQRQVMRKMLSDQKHSYMEMKRKYSESQYEIRRLKRESLTLQRELEVCSTILLNANKTYKEKLNERINQLLKEKERLENKLTWTQDKLILVSNEQGVDLVDSMLKFWKEETHNLQDQLHNLYIQKGLVEANLENSQEELAKWRFEALKLRYILKHYESILEEHNIKYESFKDCSNFKLNPEECKKFTPDITFYRGNSNLENKNKNQEQFNTIKCENSNDEVMKTTTGETNHFEIREDTTLCLPTINTNNQTENNREITEKENLTSPLQNLVIKSSPENGTANDGFDIYEDTTTNIIQMASIKETKTKNIDDKENYSIPNIDASPPIQKESILSSKSQFSICDEDSVIHQFTQDPQTSSSVLKENSESNKIINTEINKPSSILIQNRGILDFADGKKSVKFNQNVEDETSLSQTKSNKSSNPKALIKTMRSKSDILIRRIEILPRNEKK